MVFPKPLKQGDYVGVVAPSSPIRVEECKCCQKQLEKMGYRVLVADGLKKNENIFGYLAGNGRQRGQDINYMFQNPKIKGIFCVRGGYGASQLLPYLDYEMIRQNPKVFIGYSDVTSIHSVLQKYCNLVTFHGPMVKTDLLHNKINEYTIKSLQNTINMDDRMIFENPMGESFTVLQEGQAYGRLIGGNLSVLARSVGTPFAPCTQNSILFLEEIGESIPRIDMYLTQLKYAGMFAGVKGILLGDFTECSNVKSAEELTVEVFLKRWFKQFSLPVLGNLYSDHRAVMGTLPLGAWCEMNTYERKVIFYRLDKRKVLE